MSQTKLILRPLIARRVELGPLLHKGRIASFCRWATDHLNKRSVKLPAVISVVIGPYVKVPASIHRFKTKFRKVESLAIGFNFSSDCIPPEAYPFFAYALQGERIPSSLFAVIGDFRIYAAFGLQAFMSTPPPGILISDLEDASMISLHRFPTTRKLATYIAKHICAFARHHSYGFQYHGKTVAALIGLRDISHSRRSMVLTRLNRHVCEHFSSRYSVRRTFEDFPLVESPREAINAVSKNGRK